MPGACDRVVASVAARNREGLHQACGDDRAYGSADAHPPDRFTGRQETTFEVGVDHRIPVIFKRVGN
jgi:hypothetical protein